MRPCDLEVRVASLAPGLAGVTTGWPGGVATSGTLLAPTERGLVEPRTVCTLGTGPATATQQPFLDHRVFPPHTPLTSSQHTHAHPECTGVARTTSKVHTMQRQDCPADHPVDLPSTRLHRDECKSPADRNDKWNRSDPSMGDEQSSGGGLRDGSDSERSDGSRTVQPSQTKAKNPEHPDESLSVTRDHDNAGPKHPEGSLPALQVKIEKRRRKTPSTTAVIDDTDVSTLGIGRSSSDKRGSAAKREYDTRLRKVLLV